MRKLCEQENIEVISQEKDHRFYLGKDDCGKLRLQKTLLVTISGIDGSGKTTFCRRLIERLRKKGLESMYLWGGYRPVLLAPFSWVTAHPPSSGRNRSFWCRPTGVWLSIRLIRFIYKFVIILDYILQTFARLMLHGWLRKVIVCDRYYYDFAASLAANLAFSSSELLKLLNLMNVFPKPDVSFLIDVHEKTAFSRKKDVPNLEFLSKRRKIYLFLAKREKIDVLSGSSGFNGMDKKIVGWIDTLTDTL